MTARVPVRTCLGCRRTRPQTELLRIVRTPDGRIEPDLARRGHGRGAYLCRREACLLQCVRRSSWTRAFRAPTVATAEAVTRLRDLVGQGTAELVERGS
jgi:predicted RNA-binding protein YlxR (DUF448 family)